MEGMSKEDYEAMVREGDLDGDWALNDGEEYDGAVDGGGLIVIDGGGRRFEESEEMDRIARQNTRKRDRENWEATI